MNSSILSIFVSLFLILRNAYGSLCKENSHILLLGQVPVCLCCVSIQEHPSTWWSSRKKPKLTRVTRKLRSLYHVNGECLSSTKENQCIVLAEDETLLVMVKTVYLWYKMIIGCWVRTKLLQMLSGDQHAGKYMYGRKGNN